ILEPGFLLMNLTDKQYRVLNLVLGAGIMLQSAAGVYLLMRDDSMAAVVMFSGLAAVSGALAVLNSNRN
ncbi:MAG: hypothetical protein ABEJ93_03180, partial [Candidatus Nanohalobium sp.]